MAALVDAPGARATRTGALELYRELAVAVKRLAAGGVRSTPAAARPIAAG